MNDIEVFKQILYKDFNDRQCELRQGKFNLAHYTHSKIAVEIIQNGQIWLGNIQYMNDYSEISNGINLLNYVVQNTEEGRLLSNTLSKISPNIFAQLLLALKSLDYRFLNTYAFCLTEFGNDDIAFGRLSMWRAYAEKDGVALVFNNKILQNILGIEFLAMFYYDENDLKKDCYNIAKEIERNIAVVRRVPLKQLVEVLSQKISYAYLSLKHKAFLEEREWRVLYNPNFIEPNKALDLSLEKCFDVPRFVYKFNYEEAGLKTADILEKVLIGPSNNAERLKEVFVKILKDKGITNAEERVVCTNIPLRC